MEFGDQTFLAYHFQFTVFLCKIPNFVVVHLHVATVEYFS
jgi:hypothetical protein